MVRFVIDLNVLSVLIALGSPSALASEISHPETVAGLTAALMGATTDREIRHAVAGSREAGLSDIQIANALGRAMGRAMAQNGSTEPLAEALATIEVGSSTLYSEVMAAFRAGEITAAVLVDYRGLANTPWGGSGGSTGGRNE